MKATVTYQCEHCEQIFTDADQAMIHDGKCHIKPLATGFEELIWNGTNPFPEAIRIKMQNGQTVTYGYIEAEKKTSAGA